MDTSKLRYGFGLLLCFASSILAQTPTLGCNELAVGQPFTVTLVGGIPSMPAHIVLDQTPGPIVAPGLGTVHLGFTPAMYAITWISCNLSGQVQFASSVHNDASYAGNMVYAQAACFAPTAPAGAILSNPLAQGIHPTPCGQGVLSTLSLGEDTAVTVNLPFAFPFYGQTWTQVGVSSNGLLTFGGTNIDPTEHVGDFISGLPKIAVLWDDLSPQVQGSVTTCSTPTVFQIAWSGVPQFYLPDSNSAVVSLHANGTISMTWPGIDLADSLVGIAPGALQGALAVANFSSSAATGISSGAGPLFEIFLPCCNPFDLQGRRITFKPTATGYRWVR